MKQILEKKELFHHEFSARHRHGEVNEVKTAAALVRWSPSKRCIDRLHRQTGRSTDNGATFFFSRPWRHRCQISQSCTIVQVTFMLNNKLADAWLAPKPSGALGEWGKKGATCWREWCREKPREKIAIRKRSSSVFVVSLMLEINSWISNAPGCTQYRHTAEMPAENTFWERLKVRIKETSGNCSPSS